MSSTQASRPEIPVSYGVPASTEGMLSWSYVTQRLEKARNYWIATTRPDGRPHVVPVWGIWNDDAFYFGGEPTTRWVFLMTQLDGTLQGENKKAGCVSRPDAVVTPHESSQKLREEEVISDNLFLSQFLG